MSCSYHQYHSIGTLGSAHSSRNVCRSGVAYGATLGIYHLSLLVYGSLNTVEHVDNSLACLRSGVVAKLIIRSIGIRTDYCYALQILLQRQHTVVLEQHCALLSHLLGYGTMLSRTAHLLGSLRIDIRIFKQSLAELQREHIGYGTVEVGIAYSALLKFCLQIVAEGITANVHIQSRLQGERRTLGIVVGCAVGSDGLDRVKVAVCEALESPLAAQHVGEQLTIEGVSKLPI